MPYRNRFAHSGIFHKKVFAIVTMLVIAAVITVGSFVIAEILDVSEPIEIEKNTDLTYYLHVKYDGVDVTGTQSNNATTAQVLSDRIEVTDTLPKGLTFKGFVTSSDGSFGSVARNDSSTSCSGHVYDDTPEQGITEGAWDTEHKNFHYHGLHYNDDTRVVSFYVDHLQAGCQLTVGIITHTPSTVDDPDTPDPETRRDFYNTAYVQEGLISARSNTVHVFMGELNVPKFRVFYHYDTTTAQTPDNAPSLPEQAEYAEGASVVVEPDLQMEGYDFFGWSTANATVTNNQFEMPDHDVHLYGYFTPKAATTKYNVIYTVRTEDEDNDPLPSWAVAPRTNEYEEGESVSVDSTTAGLYDGYEFSGWLKRTDGAATNNKAELIRAGDAFEMPDHDVYIYGYYSRKSYTVTYQFEGTIIPTNADELLPEPETHYPGDTVTTASNPTANGYRFLGWYKGATFVMPEEDVIIYGEWGLEAGTFEPTITKTILDDRPLDDQGNPIYTAEDVAHFKITLCNTANFEIHDVILQEQLEKAKFTVDGATLYNSDLSDQGEALSVTLSADSIIRINTIPANHCGVVYSTYDVLKVNEEIVTNTVEMIGALADNNYNLDTSHPYVAIATFRIAQYNEPEVHTGVESKNMFIFIGLVIIAVAGGGVVILNRRKS